MQVEFGQHGKTHTVRLGRRREMDGSRGATRIDLWSGLAASDHHARRSHVEGTQSRDGVVDYGAVKGEL